MPKRTVAIDDSVPRAHAAQWRFEFGARHASVADQPSRRGARLRATRSEPPRPRRETPPGATVTTQRHLYGDYGRVDMLRLRSHNDENRTKLWYVGTDSSRRKEVGEGTSGTLACLFLTSGSAS